MVAARAAGSSVAGQLPDMGQGTAAPVPPALPPPPDAHDMATLPHDLNDAAPPPLHPSPCPSQAAVPAPSLTAGLSFKAKGPLGRKLAVTSRKPVFGPDSDSD